jgi:hypothetical protein
MKLLKSALSYQLSAFSLSVAGHPVRSLREEPILAQVRQDFPLSQIELMAES